MDSLWQVWSYVNLVLAIVMVCFAFAWRAQRGKALFCIYGVLAVVLGLLSVLWRLLLGTSFMRYGGLAMSIFRGVLFAGTVAEAILLFAFVLTVWAGGRSAARPAAAGSPVAIGPPIWGVKRASFGLWIALAISTNVLSFLSVMLMVIGSAEYEDGIVALGVGLLLLTVGLSIWLTVLSCIYIYRMWWMLPASYARTTPGKALGFCFIPFFNLYWLFVAMHGWSKDYNRFLFETGRTDTRRVPEGLFLTMCILSVAGAIPFVNWLVAIPNMIIWMVVFYNICRAINAMSDECARHAGASDTVVDLSQSQ